LPWRHSGPEPVVWCSGGSLRGTRGCHGGKARRGLGDLAGPAGCAGVNTLPRAT
jgi:hypothetical protein